MEHVVYGLRVVVVVAIEIRQCTVLAVQHELVRLRPEHHARVRAGQSQIYGQYIAINRSQALREAEFINWARKCECCIVESDVTGLSAGASDRKELCAAVKAVDPLPETDKGPSTNVPVITVGHGPTCKNEPKDYCRSQEQVIAHYETPIF